MQEKDIVGIVIFDLIAFLPTNHIIILQWHTGRFMRKRSMLTFK